jgi:hypothetical protein
MLKTLKKILLFVHETLWGVKKESIVILYEVEDISIMLVDYLAASTNVQALSVGMYLVQDLC